VQRSTNPAGKRITGLLAPTVATPRTRSEPRIAAPRTEKVLRPCSTSAAASLLSATGLLPETNATVEARNQSSLTAGNKAAHTDTRRTLPRSTTPAEASLLPAQLMPRASAHHNGNIRRIPPANLGRKKRCRKRKSRRDNARAGTPPPRPHAAPAVPNAAALCSQPIPRMRSMGFPKSHSPHTRPPRTPRYSFPLSCSAAASAAIFSAFSCRVFIRLITSSSEEPPNIRSTKSRTACRSTVSLATAAL
jgi:hypothetical protein